MRLLGVFAHPDDEVFCAGGTIARWADGGGETMILSATRGEAGQIQDARAATRDTLGLVRERELQAACAHLGVRHVACLDYGDGTLADVEMAELAGQVAAYIREFQPDIVVTFGPDGGYGHPDHIAIGAATTSACQIIAREDGWAPHLYYAAFPRQHGMLCHELARWLTERAAPFHGSDAFVRALSLVADELTTLGHADDAVAVRWFPAGFAIIERGERATGLHIIISGHVEMLGETAHASQQIRECLGPGQFFGARALAARQPYEATVIALDTVTCLVLSDEAATNYAGRGEDARLGGAAALHADAFADDGESLTSVNVADHVAQKVAALAEHRTQFAIPPEMLTLTPVWQMLAQEYFQPVTLNPRAAVHHVDNAADPLAGRICQPLAVPA